MQRDFGTCIFYSEKSFHSNGCILAKLALSGLSRSQDHGFHHTSAVWKKAYDLGTLVALCNAFSAFPGLQYIADQFDHSFFSFCRACRGVGANTGPNPTTGGMRSTKQRRRKGGGNQLGTPRGRTQTSFGTLAEREKEGEKDGEREQSYCMTLKSPYRF